MTTSVCTGAFRSSLTMEQSSIASGAARESASIQNSYRRQSKGMDIRRGYNTVPNNSTDNSKEYSSTAHSGNGSMEHSDDAYNKGNNGDNGRPCIHAGYEKARARRAPLSPVLSRRKSRTPGPIKRLFSCRTAFPSYANAEHILFYKKPAPVSRIGHGRNSVTASAQLLAG